MKKNPPDSQPSSHNNSDGSSREQSRTPARLVFRADGLLNYSPQGCRDWSRGLVELSAEQYLSLQHRLRYKVILREFSLGRSLVAGSPLIVSRTA